MPPCCHAEKQLPTETSGRNFCTPKSRRVSEAQWICSWRPSGEIHLSLSLQDGNLGFRRTVSHFSIMDVSEDKKDDEQICVPQTATVCNSRVFILWCFPGWFLLRSKYVLKNLWERCWQEAWRSPAGFSPDCWTGLAPAFSLQTLSPCLHFKPCHSFYFSENWQSVSSQ